MFWTFVKVEYSDRILKQSLRYVTSSPQTSVPNFEQGNIQLKFESILYGNMRVPEVFRFVDPISTNTDFFFYIEVCYCDLGYIDMTRAECGTGTKLSSWYISTLKIHHLTMQ